MGKSYTQRIQHNVLTLSRKVDECKLLAFGVVARVFSVGDFLGSTVRLAWAKANGCPWDERTCELAARGGHLVALQWARAQGCMWCEKTCARAARGGHLAVLQWAREYNCPWDEGTSYSAAYGGHLAGA